jgi:hypothetical protein
MQLIFAVFITLFFLSLSSSIFFLAIGHHENIDSVIERAKNSITSILLTAFVILLFIAIK